MRSPRPSSTGTDPDVVVGSSRGGARGDEHPLGRGADWCFSARRGSDGEPPTTVKPGTMILHSEADDVIPIADSRELVARSGLPQSALIVVGTDHRLADPEPLAAMLAAVEGRDPLPRLVSVVTSGNRPQALDHPVHLVLGGVAGTADANQSVASLAEPLGHGLGVEVAVRGEDPAPSQPGGDLGGREFLDDERKCRRSRGRRRRPEESNPRGVAQAFPELLQECAAPLVEDLEDGCQTLAAGHARRCGSAGCRASPASLASPARNSTAAAAPTIPSWFWVPVSIRSGAVSGAGLSLVTSSDRSSSRLP